MTSCARGPILSRWKLALFYTHTACAPLRLKIHSAAHGEKQRSVGETSSQLPGESKCDGEERGATSIELCCTDVAVHVCCVAGLANQSGGSALSLVHILIVGLSPAEGWMACPRGSRPSSRPTSSGSLGEVVEGGGVENYLQQPIGGAGRPGCPSGDVAAPGADVEWRHLCELPVSKCGLQLVLDEQVVLLAGAAPNVGALGIPRERALDA